MGRKRRHEILDRVKQEMAHGDVRRVRARLSTAEPTLYRNSLETGMGAQQLNRQRHVCANVIGHGEPRAFLVRIQDADFRHDSSKQVDEISATERDRSE